MGAERLAHNSGEWVLVSRGPSDSENSSSVLPSPNF